MNSSAKSAAAERLHHVMLRVLFEPDELVDGRPPTSAVQVEGIATGFVFHPERLTADRVEVEAIISEVVTDEFFRGKGGGWSFLQLCVDRQDRQWAEHPTMEALVCVAMGLGLAGYCLPRKFWKDLPGGVPYVWFAQPEALSSADSSLAQSL